MADYVSVLTGGTNNFATTSEHLNSLATDILSDGVVGAVYNTAGVAPMTGGLASNAQGTPNMTIAVTAGKAYVTATPSGQASQRLRANIAAQNVTISANSTGGTRYDWVYVKIDAANAANPNAAGDNVATLVTSRSTSASTDNGTPPTYGYCIAVVTVSNGATSIVNGNIADKRSATVATNNSSADGWNILSSAPNSVTYNGNRNYDLVFNSVDLSSTISPGQKLKLTRTVAAPTQCTDLESTSSQYYSKTSPNKLTFTDDFVVSAWVKLESYGLTTIASRYNGTSGWSLRVGALGNADGRIQLLGTNGGSTNYSAVVSYASIPLNKWIHITAQLDMSSFTATSTTSYIMIDGVDVPAFVQRGGTNPTSLLQAGNLEIGSENAGTQPFDGKLAQVAIFNAKVPQATMRTYMSQGLSGSETSLASAYSFNGVITDLNTTTPNDLTANNSAAATNADSPFANAVTAGLQEYAEINNVTFSTNTTVNVRVPETCMVPTSGGISNVYYSVGYEPYGLPYFTKVIGLALNNVGHGSITSSTTIALNGLASTVYLPANSKVKITVSCGSSVANSAGNGQTIIVGGLTDITVTNNRICESIYQAYGAGSIGYLETSGIYQNTTAGSVTFYGGTRVSANTGTITSDNTRPAYLRIELV